MRKVFTTYALPIFILNLVSYFPVYILYTKQPYLVDLITPQTLNVFNWYIKIYLALGIPYFMVNGILAPKEIAKLKLLLSSFKRVFSHHQIDETARVHLLKIVVKGFFAPLMLNFAFSHLSTVKQLLPFIKSAQPSFPMINNFIYHLLFFIDTSIFAFGYLVETHWLRNSIKSVEPTLFGWVVTLITYPPYNWITDLFLPIIKVNPIVFPTMLTTAIQVGILVSFGLYVWATIALLFKASNLTNRGIVTWGPYRFLRHPAYVGKNIAWWLETLPYLNQPSNVISLLLYNFIYYLRAKTEEKHLSRDPAYLKYLKTTKF